MTPRLVLDQGIPRDAAALLRERGLDCVHLGEIGMSQADDEEILKVSSERNATVVTLDADFHTILAVTGASGPSAVRVRIQGLNALAIVKVVLGVLDAFAPDLVRGSLVTVKANKTTCHKLPVGGPD